MRTLTIRLHEDTIMHIEKAAKKAGVPKAAFIRYRLERLFDGSAHNPLGFWATPEFYTMLCDALGTIWILHHNLDCLLYTSPSPRDRQKSRMPSSA